MGMRARPLVALEQVRQPGLDGAFVVVGRATSGISRGFCEQQPAEITRPGRWPVQGDQQEAFLVGLDG